jgi:hypothetical protein
MLTEYYNETELVTELNLVSDKLESMKNGWFGEKLLRLFKKNRQGGKLIQDLTYNKQKYIIEIIWDSSCKKGHFAYNITTRMETKNGQIKISFSQKDSPIFLYSPHYRKRYKERCEQTACFSYDLKGIKYKRNGREYELIDMDTDIVITRRGKQEDRLRYWITALSRDMCTSKNYQELLSRVGSQIDNDDVYEWK